MLKTIPADSRLLILAALAVFIGCENLVAQSGGGRSRQPVPHNGIYEGEFHFKREAPARVQPMGHFGPGWSRNAHLLWDGKPGERCRLLFHVVHSSRYQMRLQFTQAPDYGVFRVELNGKPVASQVDLYSGKVQLSNPLDLGQKKLAAGTHELTFHLTGANSRAVHFRKDRYLLGLDYLELKNLEPGSGSGLAPPVRVLPGMTQTQFHQFLRAHCLRCHGAEKKEGRLDLRAYLKTESLAGDLKLAGKIAAALENREMPPAETEPQPPRDSRDKAIRYLKNMVDQRVQATGDLPKIVMRRLNRLEYNNAVSDLLNLKGDLYPLPEKVLRSDYPYFDPASGFFPDQLRIGNRALGKFQVERQILTGVVPFAIDLQAEHGFNNRGSELGISPLLLETFLKLGDSIVSSPEFPDYCRDYKSVFTIGSAAKRDEIRKESRQRIQRLMFRGFRKKVDPHLLDRYHRFFLADFAVSGSFEASMKKVVVALLASPHFLFISEQGISENEVSRQRHPKLDDFELASRLSFFLWNSLPDESLLQLASSGKLSEPRVLAVQVHNMLLSPKSQSLSQDFARQWLRLDQLITSVPDEKRFPQYYSRIGCEYWKFGLQTMIEPLLLFESIVVEDRSIMELIDSDYSFRSAELQSWYDEKKPFANRGMINRFNTNQQDFLRRKLDSRREGGVMTTAAVMTMTSSPLRTSPIIRGAWVATVILNQPPPPPPDVVPEIEADDAVIEARGMTVRQRLRQHQENQSCASCHTRIDPLGFALENYDAVGRWRDTYRSGLPIDSSGKLLGRYEFKDVIQLKDVLLKHPEIFTRAFVEHLLSYALARELEISDKPAVDRIVRNVLADSGKFSRVVTEIATSYPFLHKTNVSGQPQPNPESKPEQ